MSEYLMTGLASRFVLALKVEVDAVRPRPRLRIPLGEPSVGAVSGFVWLDLTDATSVNLDSVNILAGAGVTSATNVQTGAITVTAPAPQGRTVQATNTVAGVALAVFNASGREEGRWEASRTADGFRIRHLTVTGNATEDRSYDLAAANSVGTLHIPASARVGATAPDDVTAARDELTGATRIRATWRTTVRGVAFDTDVYAETRGPDGTVVESVMSEYDRIGSGDASVRRLTRRFGYDLEGPVSERRFYVTDNTNPLCNGRLRAISSSRRAWAWYDYDALGREICRIEQLDGSSFPETLSEISTNAPFASAARITATSYEPSAGDSCHANDRDLPRRIETFVCRRIRNSSGVDGVDEPLLTAVSTWAYVRETDAAGVPLRRTIHTTGLGTLMRIDEAHAYPDDHAVPTWLRGRTVWSCDGDGRETSVRLERGTWDPTLRAFTPSFAGAQVRVETRTSFGGVTNETYGVQIEEAASRLVRFTGEFLTADGSELGWTASAYDDVGRLRRAVYSDGTSETNAYSCCRLLWSRGRDGRTVVDGVTNRVDVATVFRDGVHWRETTRTVAGAATNAVTVTREQLTGLSDVCRSQTVTVGADGIVSTNVVVFDSATQVETETFTRSTGERRVMLRVCGLVLEEETDEEVTATIYDALGRVTNVVHSAGTLDSALSYDADGKLVSVRDRATNSWTFASADDGVLTNEVFAVQGRTNALERFADRWRRPSGWTFAVNGLERATVRYSYDREGRIAFVSATNSTGRGFTVAYTNEAGFCYGSALTTTGGRCLLRTVDRNPFRREQMRNCTTSFDGSTVAAFDYSYDAASRIVSRNDDTFAYNDRDEVVRAAIGDTIFEHAYDTIGNHLLWTDQTATNLSEHNTLNQIVREILQDSSSPTSACATNALTWAAAGGFQSDGRWVYDYDAEDRLKSVTAATLTNGAQRIVNRYDWRHRRIGKDVYSCELDASAPDGIRWELVRRHDFAYDDWNLIHETVTTAGPTPTATETQYFWGADLSNTLQGAGGVGGLLAVSRNGAFYFPVYDNNGNVVKYIDESGSVVASYVYDDFGRTISQTDFLANGFPHRFSTKYTDDETGLLYYGYRFYSAVRRQWLNRDPLGEDACQNLYVPCRNELLGSIDVLGLYLKLYTDDKYINYIGQQIKKGRKPNVLNHKSYRKAFESFKAEFQKGVEQLTKCCNKPALKNNSVCQIILDGKTELPVVYKINTARQPHPEYANGAANELISNRNAAERVWGIALKGFYDSDTAAAVPLFVYYDFDEAPHRETLETLLFHEIAHHLQSNSKQYSMIEFDSNDGSDDRTRYDSVLEKDAVFQENQLRKCCPDIKDSNLRGWWNSPPRVKGYSK